MSEKKQAMLDRLRAAYKNCMNCPLATQGRTKVVFGSGSPDAKLMLVGEAPGEQEDAQGIPFVGRSGKLLTQILSLLGIERQNIYISNIVKCRPPSNRKPVLESESLVCKKLLLLRQISIIQPQVICTLGSAALEGLLESAVRITQKRGIRIQRDSYCIIPTFHPAYILRNPRELPTFTSDLREAAILANLFKEK